MAKLAAIQSDVNSSVAAIAASMVEQDSKAGENISPVMMARAKTFKDFSHMLPRQDEEMVHVELVEIRGLEFAKPVMESVFCCVRFKGYKLNVNVSRTMQVDGGAMTGSSVRTIHLMAANDIPIPVSGASDEDMVRVQVAYGSPGRFLGVADFTVAELKSVHVGRKEKYFQCDLQGSTCRGTIVINIRGLEEGSMKDDV